MHHHVNVLDTAGDPEEYRAVGKIFQGGLLIHGRTLPLRAAPATYLQRCKVTAMDEDTPAPAGTGKLERAGAIVTLLAAVALALIAIDTLRPRRPADPPAE